MGLFEKRRARKFFIYVQDYEENDPKSHEGLDLNKVTARDLITYVLIALLSQEMITYISYFFMIRSRVLLQTSIVTCTCHRKIHRR